MISEDIHPEEDATARESSSLPPIAVSSKTYKVFSVLFTAIKEYVLSLLIYSAYLLQ